MRKAPAFLKSSVIALPCRSEITVETTATESVNLNTVEIIGFCGGRNQVVLGHQRQGWHGFLNVQQGQSNNWNNLSDTGEFLLPQNRP